MGSSGWACSDILILLLVFMRKLLITFSLYSTLFFFPCPLVRTKFPSRVIHTPPGFRQLEIRLRWEHREKRTCAQQAGDSPEQEPQAGRAILLAQRHHSSQRGRSPLERCPVPALGDDAAAEWPRQPAAAPLASARLVRSSAALTPTSRMCLWPCTGRP